MKKTHVLLVLMYIAMSWATLAASEFKITRQNEINLYEQLGWEMTYHSGFSKGAFRYSLITGGGFSTSRSNQYEHDLNIEKYYGFVGLMWEAYSGGSDHRSVGLNNLLWIIKDLKLRPYIKMRAGYASFEVEDSEFSFLPHEFIMLDMILGTDIVFPHFPPPFEWIQIGINLDAGYSLKQSSIILPLSYTIGAGLVF